MLSSEIFMHTLTANVLAI